MISNRAPYDRWRAGEGRALSEQQRIGARAFRRACASCHSGPDLSDGGFHAIAPASRDHGLGEVTGRRADDGRFRTPPLRNVALTAPYLHDGSAQTLGEATDSHGAIASGLGAEHRIAIVAFLGALTDRAFIGDPRYALPQSACGVAL
ncbi:cytochrome-c peroxidase [Sphingomonas naasensis]|uniref:cytochrome-c peroxidase n=1 Tax=Sphingomonas naasensis TaxID=1344951 RepID=UPI003B82E3C9